jgi:hypothetical protein
MVTFVVLLETDEPEAGEVMEIDMLGLLSNGEETKNAAGRGVVV